MIKNTLISAFAITSTLLSPQIFAAVDANAASVMLYQSCDDGSGGTLDNCFTDSLAMFDWVDNTRNPSSLAPLEVKVGPGTFTQSNFNVPRWLCDAGEGHGNENGAANSLV